MDLPVPLVDVAWLREALGSPGLVVFDVRWVPGGAPRAAFEAGHVPGAVLLDSDTDLAGTPFVDGPGRHPLPSVEAFSATMAARGVADGVRVVAYDDAGGAYAARVWWMLDALGHREVSVLDGGLAAWGEPLEIGVVVGVGAGVAGAAAAAAGSMPRPWPRELIADAEDVEAGLRARTSLVLDARASERYRGEIEPIDPVAGHIPGAVSAPWAANLGTDGRFLDAASLRSRFGALGVSGGGGRDVIAHCGSGLTACQDILALRVAGLGRARLYEGSWSDWVSDLSRGVATGTDPGDLLRD